MDTDDFWSIADAQGWTDETCAEMALAFISSRGLDGAFAAHAAEVAREENAGTDDPDRAG